MKKIYLSPSFQQQNIGVGNYGTEEERCNQIADAVERELKKSKEFVVIRNNPNMSLAEVIEDSNRSGADIHFSIHTNAGPGTARGCEVYAHAQSTEGDKLAQIVYRRLTAISPTQGRGVKYNSLAETRQTKAIAVLTEVAFHSNIDDANWIINNIEAIGKELALALYEYFSIKYDESCISDNTQTSTEDTHEDKKSDIFNDGKINCIYDIQECLNNKYGARLAQDNIFGTKTKQALVKALQIELNRQYGKGLVEDGIFRKCYI